MAENITKLPVKIEKTATPTPQMWQPFESLRREIDRMFDDFGGGLWRSPFRGSFFEPFRRGEAALAALPAVDVTETEKAYEITADLPGIDEKNIDVKFANGVLTIKGEKTATETSQSKAEVLYRGIAARAFERAFQLADFVVVKNASLENGLLHVDLVREIPEAKKPRNIPIASTSPAPLVVDNSAEKAAA